MHTPHKLLLVESDPGVHGVITTILRHHGCEVISAYTPEQLEEQLDHTTPDVALVNIVVDRVSGLHLIAKLRAHPHFNDRPVGILCGRVRRGDSERAQQAGADEFFSLPFDETAVLAWLEAQTIAA